MVACNLQGGLGNMMFQIATMEYLGYKNGFDVCYPNVDTAIDRISKVYHSPNARDFFKIFKNLDWHKNLDKFKGGQKVNVPFGYFPLPDVDNMWYNGYFQSEKYFPDRDFVLHLFEPADFIEQELDKYNTNGWASIHVRRGDFLTPGNNVEILERDYYYEAICKLSSNHFMVFSDDIAWCQSELLNDVRFDFASFMFIEDVNYIELYLMSQCRENIIANSTFGWWGSYLNNHPYRRIIAPSKWFSTSLGSIDLYRDEWIIV